MWRVYINRHPTLGPMVTRMSGQPFWIWGLSALAGLLVVVIPLVALGLAAILIALLVLVVLSLVYWIVTLPMRVLRMFSPRDDDGRRNVRVVVREEGV